MCSLLKVAADGSVTLLVLMKMIHTQAYTVYQGNT
jgi:hypothetical protein